MWKWLKLRTFLGKMQGVGEPREVVGWVWERILKAEVIWDKRGLI